MSRKNTHSQVIEARARAMRFAQTPTEVRPSWCCFLRGGTLGLLARRKDKAWVPVRCTAEVVVKVIARRVINGQPQDVRLTVRADPTFLEPLAHHVHAYPEEFCRARYGVTSPRIAVWHARVSAGRWIARNALACAYAGNGVSCPRQSGACLQPLAVEPFCDLTVCQFLVRQLAHTSGSHSRRTSTMLGARDDELRCCAGSPSNLDSSRPLREIDRRQGDSLDDQREHGFAVGLRRACGFPDHGQVARKCTDARAIIRTQFDAMNSTSFTVLSLDFFEFAQPLLPLPLECACYDAVIRIGRLVATFGAPSFVGCLLDAELPVPVK